MHEEPTTYRLNVAFGSRRTEGTLTCWDEAPEDRSKVKLALKGDQFEYEASSQDGYFRCLIELRRHLEAIDARIECFGSCRNVYPSPMIEAMGVAEKAFKLTLGKQAMMRDLVSIFDVADDMPLATIEEQSAFYDAWCQSLAN